MWVWNEKDPRGGADGADGGDEKRLPKQSETLKLSPTGGRKGQSGR